MAWYSSWYRNRWANYHRVDTTPKLNSYSNWSYENRYVARYDSNGRYVYRSRQPSLSQTRGRQADLNEDSGVVTLGSRLNWNAVKRQASKYDDILESKGKSDAYYVRGKGYLAIDNDVAVEIEAKYDTGSLGLNWKIVKEYGLGAAKWYQAKQSYDRYVELAEKYSNSSSYWQRRSGSRYQALADRYKPIDNGDGTFEIQGEAPVATQTIEPGTAELKVLSRNSFQNEDGDVVTLKETRVSGYWGYGSRRSSFSADTLLGVEKQTGIGGVSWKILTSRGSGKYKTFYEFDVSDDGIVMQTNLSNRKRTLTSALEKEWSLDIDGSGEVGDAVITKKRTYKTSYEYVKDEQALVGDVTLTTGQNRTYKNIIEKTFADGVFTSERIYKQLSSIGRTYKQLGLTDTSLSSPNASYEFNQYKTYRGNVSGDLGGTKYPSSGRISNGRWYPSRGTPSVWNTGLKYYGFTVKGDLNIDVDGINDFGGRSALTRVNGTYSSWLVGKDNSDTTINIDAKGAGAHTYESYRYNRVYADGMTSSRVVTGSGDDTITIKAEATLNGLNRGYVTGYRDIARAIGTTGSSIQTGDGDDTLTITARASSNIDRGRITETGISSTKIEMGAGDDEVTIDTITGQAASGSLIDMGEGDDILTLGGRFDKLADRNVFKGGDGFDTLVFNNLSNTDFDALTRQSFTFTPDKVTLGSTTFEGFEQVQIGDNLSFKPSEITSTTQFTDIIKPEVFV